MKAAVVVFPGSNREGDVADALQRASGRKPKLVWHSEASLPDKLDLIVLPGGFSHGDYLRCGAMAARSPIMREVVRHAEKGTAVLGVCNGFQILCESGLLPGALLRNENLKFICSNTWIKPVTNNSPVTTGLDLNRALKIPIAHAEGRYYADESTLNELEKNDQILFRYCDENGNESPGSNPNGASRNIAGICNATRNVFGMMPHPERAAEPVLANTDGLGLFQSLVNFR